MTTRLLSRLSSSSLSGTSASAQHIWTSQIRLNLRVIPQIFSGNRIWRLRLLKDLRILFVRPLQRWLGSTFESCWRRNLLPPPPALRPLALRTPALLEIGLCLDPCIVPLDLWQTLPVRFGQVWCCTTTALWGMDGVRRLISSAQFQQTQHFASAESFWISFHQTSESLCVMLSVFHTSSDRFQAAAMWWLYMKALRWQFLSWQVILSWLRSTRVFFFYPERCWGSWLPSWSTSLLAGCSVCSKTSCRSPDNYICVVLSLNAVARCWLPNLLYSFILSP